MIKNESALQTSQPRLSNIQALRGLAAFLVMLAHLAIIERKYSQDTLLPEILGFGLSGVDIFFVISGFIMVYVTHKWAGQAARHIPEFLYARITRIYPLYWAVSAALLIVYLIRPEWVFASSGLEPNILKSFLLWPDKAYPMLEVGWTLIHEMGFYFIFALILIASRRLRPLLICVWAALVIGGYAIGLHTHGPLTAIIFHPLSLEFCGGALLGYWLLKPARLTTAAPLLIASLVFFIASIFIHIMTGQIYPGIGWMRPATFGVAAIVLVLASYLFEQQGKTAPRWSVILGDWSYALYLTHVLSLSLIGRIWAGFDRPGVLDNLIMLPLMLIAALIVAGLAHKLIEVPIMRATKYMRQNHDASRTDNRS